MNVIRFMAAMLLTVSLISYATRDNPAVDFKNDIQQAVFVLGLN